MITEKPFDWTELVDSGGLHRAEGQRALHAFLSSVLRSTLADESVPEFQLDDLAERATFHVVARVGRFDRQSNFTTWAAVQATRFARYTLRRQDEASAGHARFQAARRAAGQSSPRNEDGQPGLLDEIELHLSHDHRVALMALLRSIPLVEIAEQMNLDPQSAYRLFHEARLLLHHAPTAHGGQRHET